MEPTNADTEEQWMSFIDEVVDKVQAEQTLETPVPDVLPETDMFQQPSTTPPVKHLVDEAQAKTESYVSSLAPPHVQKVLSEVPVAFEEPSTLVYKQDEVDAMFSKERSFLSDFVNLGRGIESPTAFFVWGALWTVSTVLSRNAWLQWYPNPLWPNIFVILVAPAGICRKSAAMDIGEYLIKYADGYHPSNLDAFANSTKILNKSTPEGLFQVLIPSSRTFLDTRSGQPVQVEHTSKAALIISELATFLGKQQYNGGLVNMMTDLYDSRCESTTNTQSRGEETIKDIYVTMIGGITPTGMRESIPQEALGGGFMSRAIPVYQDVPTKIIWRPVRIEGYPHPEEIGKKLAWIAANKRGEYDFSPEAEALYGEWYTMWKRSIVSATLMEHENRMDVHIRKTALLLCACQYDTNRIVQKQHVALAIKLVTYTLRRANRMVSEIGASPFVQQMDTVREYIRKTGQVERRKLVHRFTKDIVVDQLQLMLTHMQQSGLIRIELNGIAQVSPSSNSKELYVYTEDLSNEPD